MKATDGMSQLPSLTKEQEAYLWNQFHFHGINYSNGSCECLACGHKWTPSEQGAEQCCPHCGTTLSMSKSRAAHFSETFYMAVLTTYEGSQVLRYIEAQRWSHRYLQEWNNVEGRWVKKPTLHTWHNYREVVQIWLDEQGNEAVATLPGTSFWNSTFMWNGKMRVRGTVKQVQASQVYGQRIFPHVVCPDAQVLPIFERNGYTLECDDVDPRTFMLAVLTPFGEMLAKTKRFDFLSYYGTQCARMNTDNIRYHAIRIAIRHHYYPTDIHKWFNYLDNLRHFEMDDHNPKYVCPADLDAANRELNERRVREYQREAARREQIRIEAKARKLDASSPEQKRYEESKSRFFPLDIEDGEGLVIKPLRTIQEFYDEGESMHHCVFNCEYYKSKSSLILSARYNGERAETIEFSLTTMKILQSRAKFNGVSPYHERIIALMQKNLDRIQQLKDAAPAAGNTKTA
jgi:predicted RNA-binding Zn-ribbon protein involved in translation (DUF1610 family)